MALLSDVELLARLVAFDTTSCHSNLPLLDFVCDYLDRPGVRCSRHGPDDQPKANLIVEVGPQIDPATRDGLVLSGHVDVVPAEEEEWTSDPFTLTPRDGDLFGRGSADMKGFVALAVNAAARWAERSPERPLVLVLTYDEELGTCGARQLASSWPEDRPLPRRAVIGEPTEMKVVRLHKGHLSLRYTVRGKSAHSGYPHLGRNAIEAAARLVAALTEAGRRLQNDPLDSARHFPEAPFATVTVARIEGGRAINVVPDRCVVEAGMRLLPGMDPEGWARRLEEVGDEALAGEEHACELLSLSPPMAASADADHFRFLCELLGQDGAEAMHYATDAGWLSRMGMECLLFGPGSIRVAHRPDEFLPRKELEEASEVVEELVARFCG